MAKAKRWRALELEEQDYKTRQVLIPVLIGFFLFILPGMLAINGLLEQGVPASIAIGMYVSVAIVGGLSLILMVQVYKVLGVKKNGFRPKRLASIVWLRKFQSGATGDHDASILIDELQDVGIDVVCLADQGYYFSHAHVDRMLARRKVAAFQAGWQLAGPAGIIASNIVDSLSNTSLSNRADYFNEHLKFTGLEGIRKELSKKRRRPAAAIFRTTDEDWQEAVQLMMNTVDVIIIDLSDLTENIA